MYLGTLRCVSIKGLPESLKVNGSLRLRGCTNLTHLPESLTVSDSLDLGWCTSLTNLPESLTVNGYLILWGCNSLTHLPESLSVAGNLWLNGCTSLRNLAGDIKGTIHCDAEFVDQIEDWVLNMAYVPHFIPEIQVMIEKKLRHGS